MKNKKHLAFYKRCMKLGKFPKVNGYQYEGLCDCAGTMQYLVTDGLIDKELLVLFEPTLEDKHTLLKESVHGGYWGYEFPFVGDRSNVKKMRQDFTPLRQTIVLFMAAINNEL